MPALFQRQELDDLVTEHFGIQAPQADISNWAALVEARISQDNSVRVAMVGKYVDLADAYKSVNEALSHAGLHTGTRVDIHYVDSETVERDAASSLSAMDAILVPGGFGERGIEGKIAAAGFARAHGVPYFGICLGMQVACIEFARSAAGLVGAHSTEFVAEPTEPVIALVTEWFDLAGGVQTRHAGVDLGGTMRLGEQRCRLVDDTLAARAYGAREVFERHRHRYEFNERYRGRLAAAGLVFSGFSIEDELVEIVELADHPWFLGCQFHPEFTSTPRSGHPLFIGFIRARAHAQDHAGGRCRMNLCGLTVGIDQPLFLIAGPDSLESKALALDVAGTLAELCSELGIGYIFKGSFDKANRSSVDSYRGPGMDAGLETLAAVKREIGVPVTTDVHVEAQIAPVATVVDMLQTPAFLCRQTDFIQAAAASGVPVNVKKGQFLAPGEMQSVVAKARAAGGEQILVCERGYAFGYNNLVVDMRSLALLRATGCPVVFDATHSVQLPGGQGKASGGAREHIPVLARAAVGAGVAGLFMETHPDPESALCDGPNSWPLAQARGLLETLVELDGVVKRRGYIEYTYDLD